MFTFCKTRARFRRMNPNLLVRLLAGCAAAGDVEDAAGHRGFL